MRTGSFLWATALVAMVGLGAGCGGESSDDPSGTAGSGGSGGGGGSASAGASGGAGEGQGGSGAGSGGAAGEGQGGAAGEGQAGSAGQGQAGSAGQGQAGSAGSAGSGAGDFVCEGDQAIKPGLNEKWQAGGKARKFYAEFPKDTTKPLAVVFLYHGFGDTAVNFKGFGPSPDADPEFPFVLVTPEDTDLLPLNKPQGLDWDLFSGKAADPNLEGALFESVVGCLSKSHTVDQQRLYAVGFSAGAILTNMMHSRYQGKLAATVAFSGAWFNDPAQVDGVNTLGFKVDFSWEPLDPSKGGMILLTHGGANDVFGQGGQQVIDFEECATEAKPFLLASKRPFIDCAHDKGHKPHPGITESLLVNYLKAHRAGSPSPYAGGKLPADFPSSCTLHEP